MKPDFLETLSDQQLAQEAQGGNVVAFEHLVERYESALLRYVLRISSFSREEAEEILQEAFLKAWRSLNDFDSNEKFSSWIYRITHNQTISEFRKAKSRGRDQELPWDETVFATLPDKIDIPAAYNQQLNSSKIRETLSLLPEKYRTVLILNFLEEKNYDEISDILRIPPGTVATLLRRAKDQLREVFQRQGVVSWAQMDAAL